MGFWLYDKGSFKENKKRKPYVSGSTVREMHAIWVSELNIDGKGSALIREMNVAVSVQGIQDLTNASLHLFRGYGSYKNCVWTMDDSHYRIVTYEELSNMINAGGWLLSYEAPNSDYIVMEAYKKFEK